jgi:mannose/fructose/N-acetylgalactosamine-specific phosphotransferase system component IID
MYLRLFAVQGAWNYETMLGNGIAFCTEPALRQLPGGIGGERYAQAIGRQARYFNSHPYLAGIAVGALTRAELDEVPATMIERFRTALGGPLGSVGDRLVWASWLPFCSLIALLAFGLGARPLTVVAIFLVIYNIGHLSLRAWGLHVGFQRVCGTSCRHSDSSCDERSRWRRPPAFLRDHHPCNGWRRSPRASRRKSRRLADFARCARGIRSLLGDSLNG